MAETAVLSECLLPACYGHRISLSASATTLIVGLLCRSYQNR
jgi:hypothetical protein